MADADERPDAATGPEPVAAIPCGTERVQAFSDAVIAIALTLLVIELRPPHLEPGEGALDLIRALADLWPRYLGVLVSFVTIGTMWITHHDLFRFIARTDPRLIALNTLLLLLIAVLPFPTALMADYLGQPGAEAAVLVYGGWRLVTSLVFFALWHHASANRDLLAAALPQVTIDDANRRVRIGPLLFLVAALIALVNPMLSVLAQLGLAIYYVLPYGADTGTKLA